VGESALQSAQLFDAVLARYIEDDADEIRIVSGYASPEMCTRLLLAARERGRKRLIAFQGVGGV